MPIKTESAIDEFSILQTRRRLKALRKLDPTTMDVETTLQWIRLELVSYILHGCAYSVVFGRGEEWKDLMHR